MTRLLAVAAAALALAAAAATTPGGAAHPKCVEAAGEHHVAIVVEHGTGATLTRCVPFTADSITAQQAMDLSGIEYQTASYGGGLGAAVCQIDYEPETYPPGCWTSTSPYWAMFVSRAGGGWAVSQRGLSSQTLQDGDALGWHYVPQSGSGGGPPPSPAGVCAQQAAPPPVTAPPPAAAGPQPPAPAPETGPGAAQPSAGTPAPPGTAATPEVVGSVPSDSPSGKPVPAPAVRRSRPADTVDLGILTASLGGGALLGLLVLQLIAVRLRS